MPSTVLPFVERDAHARISVAGTSQAEPRGAQGGRQLESGRGQVGGRQRAEQLRAKRLAKKEKMDRLTTGNYSIWQMSKCLGPKRSRKIGLEMQRVVEVGRGPVKSVFLVDRKTTKQGRESKRQKKNARSFSTPRENMIYMCKIEKNISKP